MKIAILIVTRKRPNQLVTCITSFDTLASGEHDISYYVRYDDDDDETPKALALIGEKTFLARKVIGICMPRPMIRGVAWNECLPRIIRDGFDALIALPDDLFMLVPGWDRGVSVMINDRGCQVFSLREYNDNQNANYAVMTPRWIEAAGTIYPDWFPFWFADTWLTQVYEFALGQPLMIVADLILGGYRGTTQGMRDLAFWIEFWKATRILRQEEGIAIRRRLGWPEVPTQPVWDKFVRLDGKWNIPAIEAAMGAEKGEPSHRYFEARARAEEWVRANARPAA